MKKITLITFCSLITLSTLSAQTINKVRLDSLLELLVSNNKGMGSLAIRKSGELIYSKAVGCGNCDPTSTIPATDETIYRIGSISKIFTAVMIFQLIEEGKLKLDTKLKTFYPELANADQISINQLLYHRSGLHDFTNEPDYLSWNTQVKVKDDLIKMMAKYPSDFAPDSKAEYSNSNYVILGYIIEKITGKAYKDELKRRITDKLGLPDTYFGGKMEPNEAYSYNYVNGWQKESITDMSIPHGAGAIVSTPTDLTKFIDFLFGHRLLKPESLEKMKTIKDGYGMGMFQFPFGNRIAYGHNGGIDGFSSILGYFPDDKLAISYITNAQVYPINDIVIGVLSIIYGTPYTLPNFRTYAITTEELDKYLGIYASADLPLKITITKNQNVLMAKATGQPAFPLEAKDSKTFSFDQAGVVLIFDAETKQMKLQQGGGEFLFNKE